MLRSPLAFHSPQLQRASESPLFIQCNKKGRGEKPFSPKANEWIFLSLVGGTINLYLFQTASVREPPETKTKAAFCCRVFLILCVLKKVLCPINLQQVPRLSLPSLQGPTACLAPRRGQEDCPRLAAPTTTPGTDFDAPRHLSPPRHSGPKPETWREAAQPTATRESERENGKEKGRGRGKERRETRPSVKRRRIKTGELLFMYFLGVIWMILVIYHAMMQLLYIVCCHHNSTFDLGLHCIVSKHGISPRR